MRQQSEKRSGSLGKLIEFSLIKDVVNRTRSIRDNQDLFGGSNPSSLTVVVLACCRCAKLRSSSLICNQGIVIVARKCTSRASETETGLPDAPGTGLHYWLGTAFVRTRGVTTRSGLHIP